MPPFIAMPLARARLDVSTAGTFVGALHFGNPAANTTVNGVTFTGINPGPFTANTITSGDFTLATANPASAFSAAGSGGVIAPFTTLSASYQSLLRGVLQIGNAAPPTLTLTMNNLMAGATYQFEWWNDTSNNPANFTTTATAGNAVTLNSNPGNNLNGGLGQYAIGTFVADATTSQAITFAGDGDKVLNGFQLRQLAPPTVPEPGSALFGLALLAPALTRRARRV